MEAVILPSSEASNMSDDMDPNALGHINGDANGSNPDSDDEVASPPSKKVCRSDDNDLVKAVSDNSSLNNKQRSPIVVELTSETDSPVKQNNVKYKDSKNNGRGHTNGEVSDDDISNNGSDKIEELSDTEDIEEVIDADKSKSDIGVEEINDLSDSKNDSFESDSEHNKTKDQDESENDRDASERTPPSTPNDRQKMQQEARRKSAEARKQALLNVTPRRSSRNLNKLKKYIDGESDPDEPDIQEIMPVDPLAVSASDRVKLSEKDPLLTTPEKEVVVKARKKNTIIVSDTKALAQIAASSKEGKKEPTLVIIDTNSILSGRGPVPVSSTPPPSSLPPALPAQGIYPLIPPQTTLTPAKPQPHQAPTPAPLPPPVVSAPSKPKGPVGLTDDMYVVEAPSFIVPYVYEKPPKESMKETVEKLSKQIREEEKKEREEKKEKKRKEREEKAKKEQAEKESQNSQANSSETQKDEKSLDQSDNKNEAEPMDVDQKEKEKDVTVKEEEEQETKTENDPDYKKDSDEEEAEYDSDSGSSTSSKASSKPKTKSYFDSPLGKFFMQIGINLVQEHVQTDLLRMQKRKLQKGGSTNNPETQIAVQSLLKNLEQSKENNEPYKFEMKSCEFCNFKTESSIVLAHHLEIPHLKNFMYHCNFCSVSLRTNHDILFHMEAEHNINGRIERAPAFHQCPNCPFEDNQKSKMTRHSLSCQKRFRPEKNMEPPLDWEPPAKIPRMSKNMGRSLLPGSPISQQQYLNQRLQGLPQHPLLPKLPATSLMPSLVSGQVRGRGRPSSVSSRFLPDLKAMPRAIAPSQLRQGGMMYQQSRQQPVLVPTSYQIAGSQIYQRWPQQVVGGGATVSAAMPRLTLMPQGGSSVALVPNLSGSGSNSITIQSANSKSSAAKLLQQPSISITPLPRQPSGSSSSSGFAHSAKPGSNPSGKNSFVICEICDGYIKDLEQLRNHMQWIHKVKIHPKMIYNRPPLNCQKCQFRFFTDQGLERHLLGSHGLVTSSMQEASNKGKDGGRCPVCGRVYQWKLLNHVAKDHNMTLKPAHLSYKCTVCTATFGMYKQFENHVYSAHSVVAKRVMDKKAASNASSSSSSRGFSAAESLLKPLKINDEITIIPQPAKSSSVRAGSQKKAPCQADDSGSENSL